MSGELNVFEEFWNLIKKFFGSLLIFFLLNVCTPFTIRCTNTCLYTTGGYSLVLDFWWHIQFLDEIVIRKLKHLSNNRDNKLMSINVVDML